MKNLIGLFFLFLPALVFSQCINTFTLSGNLTAACPGPTYNLSNSELGNNYVMINNDNGSIQSGPIEGTGNALQFAFSPNLPSSNLQVFAYPDSNYSINFNGIGDNLSIPSSNSLMPSNQITIEAWLYPRATNGYYEIYRKDDGDNRHLLSFQSGNILAFGIAPGGIYSELDVVINPSDYQNQWVHIAASYDGTTKRLYRNGVEIGSDAASGSLSNTGTAPLFIGSNSGVAEFFDGKIDELRLWSYARDTSQIQNGMDPCFDVGTNGLQLFLNMNQGQDSSVADLSPNINPISINDSINPHPDPNALWQSGVWQSASNSLEVNTVFSPNNIYVDQNASGLNTGADWQNAYQTLTQAMNCASANDAIYIAQGTYQEGMELFFPFSINIFGGFSTGGAQNDPEAYPTIIDGQNSHRILMCDPSPASGTLTVDGITFLNGSASDNDGGSAIYLHSLGNPNELNVSRSVFKNNTHNSTSTIRGGTVSNRLGDVKIEGSQFLNNTTNSNTTLEGGVVYVLGNIEIINSSFQGNQSNATTLRGGVIYHDGASIQTLNTEFSENTLSGSSSALGGAIYTSGSCYARYNTFAANSLSSNFSSSSGGAIHQFDNPPTLELRGCIFYGNSADTYPNVYSLITNQHINHTYIQNQFPVGVNNYDDMEATIDPLFSDTSNGDYSLQENSVFVNAGIATDNPGLLDVRGKNRRSDCLIDIGAYEYQNINDTIRNTYYFDKSQTSGIEDGLSWATAFTNINTINDLCLKFGDTIKIGEGIHYPEIIVLNDSCVIVGSFPAGGGDQDVNAYSTEFDGQGFYSFIQAPGLLLRINGVDFKNGINTGHNSIINVDQLFLENSELEHNETPILCHSIFANNCSFRNNSSLTGGGGSVYASGSGVFNNCIFENNTAGAGGAIYLNGSVLLTNCQFNNNSATNGAGAVYVNGPIVTKNSIFANNTSNSHGGAIETRGVAQLSNSLFYGNEAIVGNSSSGGAIYSFIGSPGFTNTITNCTFVDNFAKHKGGALSTTLYTHFDIENCIFSQNTALTSEDHIDLSGSAYIQHSYLSGENISGMGNINDSSATIYPLFVDTANYDFRLLPNSPLINMGSENVEANIDLAGFNRIRACAVDIGAYEFQESWGTELVDTSFCESNNPINLIDNGDNINWHNDIGLSSLLNNGNTLAINQTAGNYTFYASDSTSNCPRQLIDSILVKILELPQPSLGLDKSFCFGDSVLLDGGSFESYNWNTSDTLQSLFVSLPGQYVLQVSNALGCNNSDTILLNQTPLPNLDLGADLTFCAGDSVLLDGGSFESYNWNTSDTLQSLFVSLPGQYVLQVSNALGCNNSDTILINQTLLAQTELNISDNEIIVVNPGEGQTYSWLDCDNNFSLILDQNNASFIPQSDGNYAVEIIENGCADTSSCISFVLSDVVEDTFKDNISIYPNPTNGALFLEFQSIQELVHVSLFSIKGQKIQDYSFSHSNKAKIEFDGPAGVYFLKIINSDNKQKVVSVIYK
jgi:predicted outer membrane repeat protein